MPVSKSAIEQFFAEYARALISRDAKRIAAHWGVPAFVLSDEGAIAVSKESETEAFFASSMDQYKDVADTRAIIQHVAPLADTIAACEVVWEHRDATGDLNGGEAASYTLKQEADGLKVYVYTPKPGA